MIRNRPSRRLEAGRETAAREQTGEAERTSRGDLTKQARKKKKENRSGRKEKVELKARKTERSGAERKNFFALLTFEWVGRNLIEMKAGLYCERRTRPEIGFVSRCHPVMGILVRIWGGSRTAPNPDFD